MVKEKKIEGISGWLLIPVIGLVIVLIIYLFDIFSLLFFPYDNNLIGLFLIIDIGLFVLGIYILTLVFKKKKETPSFFIIYLWISVGAVLFLSIITKDSTGLLGGIIKAIIWTLYFKKSKRVKNTFMK